MGFPNESTNALLTDVAKSADPFSMSAVMDELGTQVSRLADLESALHQRLGPITKPVSSAEVSGGYPSASDTPPMSPRAYNVANYTNEIRMTINRIYELLDYVDA